MSATASPLPDKVPPGFRAVFIREEDYLQIVRAGELVGLRDPANSFCAGLIANAVDNPDNLLDLVRVTAENQRNEEGGRE